MIELLAQTADAASSEGRLLGLTVVEWGVLLGFVSGFLHSLFKHVKARKGDRKLEAVVHALEEASRDHPEAVQLAKRLARAKATSLGVETGIFGLEQDVRRHTGGLKRKPMGDILNPDNPTPEPDKPKP